MLGNGFLGSFPAQLPEMLGNGFLEASWKHFPRCLQQCSEIASCIARNGRGILEGGEPQSLVSQCELNLYGGKLVRSRNSAR